MHASAMLSCGIYCPRDPRTRAQGRCPPRGHIALGNRPTLAGLRSSRYLTFTNPKLQVTTIRGLAGDFSQPVLLSVLVRTWLLIPRVSSRTHQASPQWSLHHLPVRLVYCQLGCPDVWQKRHEPTPSAPPD